MPDLSEAHRKRLAAILGMLGSNSTGERDNAARLAEQFRLQQGLTWAELLALNPANAAADDADVGHPPAGPTSQTTNDEKRTEHAGRWRPNGIITLVLIMFVGGVISFFLSVTGADHPRQVAATMPRNNFGVSPVPRTQDRGLLTDEQTGLISEHLRACLMSDPSVPKTNLLPVVLQVVTDEN